MLVTCPGCESLIRLDGQADGPLANCPTCGISLADENGEQTVSYRSATDSIGHFQLLDKLGSGAFGSVWKAKDTRLDRTVAVKIPNRQDLSAQEREVFLREARAAAQLQHPNIVSVNEIGTRDDQLFIVSEFVAGCNLKEWLTGYQPSPRDTAGLIATIADALHHAHEHGVIHRDLKPANIMMDLENQPHIMDFGLAKRENGEASMTLEGQVMGTPMYMSPEQASGNSRDVDRRADVYTLGVIYFEMLTGEKPFRGEPRVVMSQIINVDAPSPRSLKTSIPKDLETICLKCLEKDPSRRYPNADSVAQELRRFLDDQPILARPISRVARAWRLCRRWPVVTTLASLLVATVTIGFIGVASQWYRANNEWTRAETNARDLANEEARKSEYLYVAHMNMIQQAWDNGLTRRARELLDRHSHRDGKPDLRTFEWYCFDALCRNALAAQTIDYGDKVSAIAVSPDGGSVALAGHDNQVQVWQLNPQRRTNLLNAHQAEVTQLQFSSDGQLLVTSDSSQVIVWKQIDGKFSKVFSSENGKPLFARISPDNKTVALCDQQSISLYDSDKNQSIELVNQNRISDFCFSNSGETIIAAGEDFEGIWSIDLWNVKSGSTKKLQKGEREKVWKIILSEDEQHLLIATTDGCHVYEFTVDDELQSAYQLVDFPKGEVDLVSPGSSLGFVAASSTSLSVWTWDSAEPTGQLFDTNKFSGSVAASKQDSMIATTGSNSVVYLWDSGNLAPRGTIRGHSNLVYGMEFLPNGGLVTISRDNTAKVWPVAETREFLQLPCGNEWLWSVAISPDNKTLATASADKRVLLWDLESGKKLCELTGHLASIQFVRFSPDGKYLASAGRDNTIRIWDCKSQSLVRELVGHQDFVNSLDFSADGSQLVSVAHDSSVILWNMETGEQVKRIEILPKHELWAVAFSPRQNRILFGGTNKSLAYWDFTESNGPQTILELKENVTSLALSRDGSLLSITTADGLITLLNCDTNEQIQQLVAHSADAMFTAFSPDGKTLISGGSEGTLQFWNMATLEPSVAFKLHAEHIHCVAFSKDGKKVATASWDGTVKVLSSE